MQYTRRECLEFRGIPKTADEVPKQIVEKIASLVDIDLEESDISVCHRLSERSQPGASKTAYSSPPLIAKFTRRDVRDMLYKKRSWLKDYTTGDLGLSRVAENKIFICESLTTRNREIFNACLNFKRENKYQFIWTVYGRSFLRKDDRSPAIVINSREDLAQVRS